MLLIALLLIGASWDMWRVGRESPAAGRARAVETAAPTAGPVAESSGAAPTSTGTTAPRLDLNHAGAAQLDALPGIGPVLAARILEQRRVHGPYRRLEDLLAVRGVGPRLLERLRPHLRLGGGDAGSGAAAMQSAPQATMKLADSTSVAPRPAR